MIKTSNKPVVDADAVVDVRTVMIKRQDATITLTTVFSSQRLHRSARVTQSTQRVWPALLAPVLKPCHLHMSPIFTESSRKSKINLYSIMKTEDKVG